MKSLLILIMILGSTLHAEVTNETETFASICTETGSVGFKWKNGDFREATYFNTTYIVKKVKDARLCTPTKFDPEKQYSLTGCYTITRQGEPASLAVSCSEYYEKDKDYKLLKRSDGTYKLKQISCPSMGFKPTGRFHKSYIHSNLSDNPKNDYKDSMSVSHGKCSQI